MQWGLACSQSGSPGLSFVFRCAGLRAADIPDTCVHFGCIQARTHKEQDACNEV